MRAREELQTRPAEAASERSVTIAVETLKQAAWSPRWAIVDDRLVKPGAASGLLGANGRICQRYLKVGIQLGSRLGRFGSGFGGRRRTAGDLVEFVDAQFANIVVHGRLLFSRRGHPLSIGGQRSTR